MESDYKDIVCTILVSLFAMALGHIAGYKMGSDSKPGEDPTLDRFKSKWYEAFFNKI